MLSSLWCIARRRSLEVKEISVLYIIHDTTVRMHRLVHDPTRFRLNAASTSAAEYSNVTPLFA